MLGTMKEDAFSLRTRKTTGVNTPESLAPNNPTSIGNVATRAIGKVESIVLYAFHELPHWQRDNHFILNGYRRELNSFKRCFSSLWYLHNETGMDPST